MKTNQQKGFTLIEILIASTIFAVIMVMATGVFSMTSSYNTKISESRNVHSEARNAMTQITNDVRLSNGSAQVFVTGGAITKVKDIFLIKIKPGVQPSAQIFESLIDGFDGANSDNAFDYFIPDSSRFLYALGIVQKSDNKIILYIPQYSDPNFSLSRKEVEIDSSGNTLLTKNGATLLSNDTSLSARFRGFWNPIKTGQQPYIYFGIEAKSLGYDTLPVSQRSKIELKTTVESRDYN